MLGNLVEEVLMNWSIATTSIMDVRGLLVQLDEKLASLEGGKFSLEQCTTRFRHPAYNFSRLEMTNMTIAFPLGFAKVPPPGVVPHEPLSPSVSKNLFTKGLGTVKVSTAGPTIHEMGASSSRSPLPSNFPVPSTIELLQFKRVQDSTGEGTLCYKLEPLSPKLPSQAWEDDFFGSCPIVEDKQSPDQDGEPALGDHP